MELYIVGQFGRHNVLDIYPQLFQCKKVLCSQIFRFLLRIMLRFCPITNATNLRIILKKKSKRKSEEDTFSAICCTPNCSNVPSTHCDMHRRDMQRQEHLPTPPLKLSLSRCLHRYLHLSTPLPLSFCLFLASAPPLPLLFLSHHILDLTNMF